MRLIPILNYPNYMISSCGNVYSKKRDILLSTRPGQDGYVRVNLYNELGKRSKKVHRLVLEAFSCPLCTTYQVNHRDGNKSNNNLSNLEWCTGSENVKHAYKYSLRTEVGEKNNSSKLTEQQVRYILSSDLDGVQLGRMFKVHYNTIYEIRARRSWKHVD